MGLQTVVVAFLFERHGFFLLLSLQRCIFALGINSYRKNKVIVIIFASCACLSLRCIFRNNNCRDIDGT